MSTPLTDIQRRNLARIRRSDPETYQEVIDVLFEAERRRRRAEYERSFLAFVKRAWQELDPSPLRLAWFHEVIIEHLEAVCNGEIRSLILNAPPRTGKSLVGECVISCLDMV